MMKTLNKYINEALIKKDTKINEPFDINLKNEIFEYLTIKQIYKNDSLMVIENWIVNNHVKEVEYVLAPATLQTIIANHYHDNDDVKYDNYNYDYNKVKKCSQKINSHCDNIYKLSKRSELYVFNDMIAHVSNDGTIYCIKK